MNFKERLARLDSAITEKRLIRNKWQDEPRNLVCLLAALSPEAGAKRDASYCPASVMPTWLAHLTTWIDDAGSIDTWPIVVRRYAAVAHTWGTWSEETWTRKEYKIRAACVREAMRHTQDVLVLTVCETVAVLCERRGIGDLPFKHEWVEAAEATSAASATAAAAWAASATAAAASASAAERAVAEAAEAAAWAASERAASERAAATAWDRMIDAMLSILEQAPDAI